MNIDISSNIKQVKKALTKFEKKLIPAATTYTVNELAFKISRQEMPKRADKVFAGGATGWTKRGFAYKKAKRGQSSSKVFIRDSQAEYMKYQIDGGTRRPKGRSILVPNGQARKNKYGNLTKGTYQKIATNQGYFSNNDKVYKKVGKKGKVKVVASHKSKANYKPKFKYFNYAKGYINNPRKGFERTFMVNLGKQLQRMK
jgi:hypothetical protein